MTSKKKTPDPAAAAQVYGVPDDPLERQREALNQAGGWAIGASRDAVAEAFAYCFQFPNLRPDRAPTPEEIAQQEGLLARMRDLLALSAVSLDNLEPGGGLGVTLGS